MPVQTDGESVPSEQSAALMWSIAFHPPPRRHDAQLVALPSVTRRPYTGTPHAARGVFRGSHFRLTTAAEAIREASGHAVRPAVCPAVRADHMRSTPYHTCESVQVLMLSRLHTATQEIKALPLQAWWKVVIRLRCGCQALQEFLISFR